MPGIKECEWCGEDFIFEYNREIYCSERCRENGTKYKRRLRRKVPEEDRIKDCEWCGESFKYKHNREVYCSEDCKELAKQYYHSKANKRYYRMYNWLIRSRTLGTASLGVTPEKDPEKEIEKIRRERERIGLGSRLFGGSMGMGIVLHNSPLIPWESQALLLIYGGVMLSLFLVHPAYMKVVLLNTPIECF